MNKKIFLTGKPGIGKTTLVLKVIEGLKDANGFYTQEIREKGQSPHPFADKIKRRNDIEIIEVTPDNRDGLVKDIKGWITMSLIIPRCFRFST